MTYLLEIKETAGSKPLIEHLKTLKYVKIKKMSGDVTEMVNTILKSEKSKRIKWDEAKKQIAAWK